MTNSQRLGQVRDALRQWMRLHSPATEAAEPASESMLIRDGFFCGRRFRYPSHWAVWFLEENQLKIHDADGQLCTACDAQQIQALAEQWQVWQTESAAAAPLESAVVAAVVGESEETAAEVQTLSLEAHRDRTSDVRRAA